MRATKNRIFNLVKTLNAIQKKDVFVVGFERGTYWIKENKDGPNRGMRAREIYYYLCGIYHEKLKKWRKL